MSEKTFRQGRPGAAYEAETGKLVVFTKSRVTVMKPWPRPQAWEKTRARPTWRHARPDVKIPRGDLSRRIADLRAPSEGCGQYLLPFPVFRNYWRAHRSDLAQLEAFLPVPAEIRDLVTRFPSRQWHMLSLLARCGTAAADLAASNPALAFALASNWVYHQPRVQRPLRSARVLLRRGKKQREILAWLRFPDTEATRRIVAKIALPALEVRRLLYVRQSLPDPASHKAMSHLARLNAGAIRIATDRALLPLAPPPLLDEIAHHVDEDHAPRAAYLLQDSAEMFRLMHPRRTFGPPARDLARLRTVHDALIDDFNRIGPIDLDAAFPDPPVAGTAQIEPVDSALKLVEEGRVQRNCVASYLDRIVRHRQVYIYRMLWPERCTLALRHRGGAWVPSEMARACNQPPSEAAVQAVREWLGESTAH